MSSSESVTPAAAERDGKGRVILRRPYTSASAVHGEARPQSLIIAIFELDTYGIFHHFIHRTPGGDSGVGGREKMWRCRRSAASPVGPALILYFLAFRRSNLTKDFDQSSFVFPHIFSS